jgi:hypothetical protein
VTRYAGTPPSRSMARRRGLDLHRLEPLKREQRHPTTSLEPKSVVPHYNSQQLTGNGACSTGASCLRGAQGSGAAPCLLTDRCCQTLRSSRRRDPNRHTSDDDGGWSTHGQLDQCPALSDLTGTGLLLSVAGCFLDELHPGGEVEFGVNVGEVGLYGAR